MAQTLNRSVKPLRRLLRHQRTHAYFKDGGWTDNPEEASSFADVLEAAQTCVRHGLSEVDLILRVPGAGFELFATALR